MNSKRQKGFSLIEILVALSVVAILAIIAIPVVGNVRSKSESVQCLSNLRQIGMANTLYHNDNGYYPPSHISAAAAGGNPSGWWSNQLRKYVPRIDDVGGDPSQTVFICPTAYNFTGKNAASHYSKNRQAGPSVSVESGSFVNAYQVVRPSEVVFVMDGVLKDNNNAEPELLGGYQFKTEPAEGNDLLPVSTEDFNGLKVARIRHDKKANAVFLDGHAESLAPEDIRKKNFSIHY